MLRIALQEVRRMMMGSWDLGSLKSDAPEIGSRIVEAMLTVLSTSFDVATRAVLRFERMID